MWADVFLTTVDEDYNSTVASPVDLSDWPERPHEVSECARVWGVNEAKQNKEAYDRMDVGDYVLFYRVGSEEYVGAGRIGALCESKWVAERYWTADDRTNLFILDAFSGRTVPLAAVNEALEYRSIYHPQGIVRVSDQRPLSKAVELFDLE